MTAFSLELQVFPGNEKMRSDCDAASGLRFKAVLISLRNSIIVLPCLHRFWEVFRVPGARTDDLATKAGPPLIKINRAHSESSL